MYLRTPKRYRAGKQRRQLRLISRRTIFLAVVAVFGVLLARYILNHPTQAQDIRENISSEADQLVSSVRTQVAPKPEPTATPNLDTAQTECDAAYLQGDLEKAIEQCTILAQNNPNDTTLHYSLTHLLIITSNGGLNANRIDEAINAANQTINASPEAPQGWAIRAMALDWNQQYGLALASALQAKALDPDFAPTYAFLGEIYHDLGRDDLAFPYIDQAISLDTGGIALADAFRNRGMIYSSQAEYEDAIQAYEIAVKQAPHHPYIAVELANNYVAMGDLDTAIATISSSLDQNPNSPTLFWALGYLYVRNGMKEKGYEYYRRCLDFDAENVSCLSYLGGLQLDDGDYPSAITTLQQAIELGSQDMDDYLELGHALATTERCADAIPYLQQGYQMAVEAGNTDMQAKFMTRLQSCNAAPLIAVPTSTPSPSPTP